MRKFWLKNSDLHQIFAFYRFNELWSEICWKSYYEIQRGYISCEISISIHNLNVFCCFDYAVCYCYYYMNFFFLSVRSLCYVHQSLNWYNSHFFSVIVTKKNVCCCCFNLSNSMLFLFSMLLLVELAVFLFLLWLKLKLCIP